MANDTIIKRRIALSCEMILMYRIVMHFAFHANLWSVNSEIVMMKGGDNKHWHQNCQKYWCYFLPANVPSTTHLFSEYKIMVQRYAILCWMQNLFDDICRCRFAADKIEQCRGTCYILWQICRRVGKIAWNIVLNTR